MRTLMALFALLSLSVLALALEVKDVKITSITEDIENGRLYINYSYKVCLNQDDIEDADCATNGTVNVEFTDEDGEDVDPADGDDGDPSPLADDPLDAELDVNLDLSTLVDFLKANPSISEACKTYTGTKCMETAAVRTGSNGEDVVEIYVEVFVTYGDETDGDQSDPVSVALNS